MLIAVCPEGSGGHSVCGVQSNLICTPHKVFLVSVEMQSWFCLGVYVFSSPE